MNANNTKITPFVIGLTGAIGTGKSLVRKMLEHKGALTIDADHLAHGAYNKGTQGYREIISHFGKDVLDSNRQIDRNRLGELVFMDPESLAELEEIIHPLVTYAVKRLISISPLPIIVVEAIKLLESDLKDHCDTIWAVASPQEIIYRRLKDARGMDRSQVDERLRQQFIRYHPDADIDTVILNNGSINDLGLEVSVRWEELSGQSSHFSDCLARTSDLMKPFRNYLIHSENGFRENSAEEIEKKNRCFLPVEQLSNEYEPDSSMNSDILNSEEAFYRYYLWKTEISPGENLVMFSDMENFIASAGIAAGNADQEAFTRIMNLVQDFSRLHLCENLFFPFNKETESMSAPLGFRKNCSDFPSFKGLTLKGYKLLCKSLSKPLNFFKG
jgi:dephospho-CoA kinase